MLLGSELREIHLKSNNSSLNVRLWAWQTLRPENTLVRAIGLAWLDKDNTRLRLRPSAVHYPSPQSNSAGFRLLLASGQCTINDANWSKQACMFVIEDVR
ncbi:hypothetical protein CEXT_541391 [Caerostris extrusa]|uniref:Uncharacterized protein n=1 Tax=Caerostris extrusa TaxID=172846 RepID=A0AAV4XDQ0_CAEEX|nr:hypothetical protein CEXT_541391 [Caerostris extrusa]